MNKPILIIGDCCLDVFVYCSCSRLCPEGPVPVLDIVETKINHGMAGNVKRNAKALNAESELLCNENFEQITKTRYVDKESNHLFIRIDSPAKIKRIENLENIDFSKYRAVIISDYNKGFLEKEDIQFIAKSHPVTFIDTKKILGDWIKDISYIKINKKEFLASENFITESIKNKVITTLGGNGCEYQGENFPSELVEVKDLSGAGDTFLAALVVKYLENMDIKESIKFANKCAGLVVQKRGVSTI